MEGNTAIREYLLSVKSVRKRNFLEKALEMGVSISILSKEFRLLKMSYKNTERIMLNEQVYFNRRPSSLLTKNKETTKILLRLSNISTPASIFARDLNEAMPLMEKDKVSFPVVIKPIDGTKGVGVSLNVVDPHGIEMAVRRIEALRHSGKLRCSAQFMVEEMRSGRNFRILVLDECVIACVERVPAHLVGDGKSTIAEIAERFNADRPDAFKLTMDQEVKEALSKNRLNVHSVLKPGETVVLREIANLSSGGVAIDRTEQISERFKYITIQSAGALGLDYCGVDLISGDIASNDPAQTYDVIEINGRPDFEMHEKPVVQGKGVDVTGLLVKRFMGIR